MKKILFLFVTSVCFTAHAQMIVRSSGNVEIGTDPLYEYSKTLSTPDTVTVLKVFGSSNNGSGSRISFGDQASTTALNVMMGEAGAADSDQLWLHGKHGFFMTARNKAQDTIMSYDDNVGNYVQFNCDVHSSGVFVQSDSRFKENVKPIENVLGSLSDLTAVSYNLKPNFTAQSLSSPGATPKDARDAAFEQEFYKKLQKDSIRYGFLAQNVKEVFPQLVRTDGEGYYYVDYIGMIPLLVQSINELQAQVEELQQQALRGGDDNPTLPSRVQAASNSGDLLGTTQGACLYQNTPNPFSSETIIRYYLPETVKQATLFIYDMQGKQLKSYAASGRGESSVTVAGSDLPAGMYFYALVADGISVGSKQMILTK